MRLIRHWLSSSCSAFKTITFLLASFLSSYSVSALTVTPNPSNLSCGTTSVTFTFDCSFTGLVFIVKPDDIDFPSLSSAGGEVYIETVTNGEITFDVAGDISSPANFMIPFLVLDSNMGCANNNDVAQASFTFNCIPPTNNDCINAQVLTLGTNSCTAISYPTLNGTFSGENPTTCGTTLPAGYLDLWYTFTANNTDITLEIPATPGTVGFYALYDNCPNAGGNEIDCDLIFGGNPEQLTGLSIGVNYTLQMLYQSPQAGTEQELCIHSITPQPPCPTIGTLIGTGNICLGDNTTSLTASNLTDMGSIYGIDFVYFTSAQSGSAMYGTPTGTLGSVTNENLTSGTSAVLNNVVYPTTVDTYYVYAIISPSPGSLSCRPFGTATITVVDPDVTLPMAQTVCEDAMTSPVIFSGSGISYDWTNDNIAIGLTSFGTNVDSIPAFTATNGGSTPITGNIVVTPRDGVCSGTSKTFPITVNPKIDSAKISGTATIINGETSNIVVTISGGIGLYTVVFSDGSINITKNSYVSGSNISVSPTSSVIYNIVSVTDANGCVSANNTGNAIITVNELEPCNTDGIITDNPSVGSYRASQTIETSGIVEVITNSDYRAGTSITLNPGFEAKLGSEFLAIIENCTSSTELELSYNKKVLENNTLSMDGFSYKIAPNPFKESTLLILDVEAPSEISAQIYNYQGLLVSSLFQNKFFEKGINKINYSANDLPSGMYILILRTGNVIQSEKIIVLK